MVVKEVSQKVCGESRGSMTEVCECTRIQKHTACYDVADGEQPRRRLNLHRVSDGSGKA